jgi:hypothetical protein
MRIIPFALGFFIVVGLRTIVFGRMSNLIDHLVVLAYFSLFSLATFIYRLYSYGHDLNPRAPIDVEPFWPTLIGTKQIANMTETSMPGVATYLLGAAALLLLLAVFHSRHEPLINESF